MKPSEAEHVQGHEGTQQACTFFVALSLATWAAFTRFLYSLHVTMSLSEQRNTLRSIEL